MTDWDAARKSGEGVPITSEGMWDEYQLWLHEKECEECGAKYKDKLPWKYWVTETLCHKCWRPDFDDDVPDEFLTPLVRAKKYAYQVRQRKPEVREWLDRVTRLN